MSEKSQPRAMDAVEEGRPKWPDRPVATRLPFFLLGLAATATGFMAFADSSKVMHWFFTSSLLIYIALGLCVARTLKPGRGAVSRSCVPLLLAALIAILLSQANLACVIAATS